MVYSSAIGIDLGTTNTLAAILQDGRSHIIPNKEGSTITPSVIYYNPNTLTPSVGHVAEDQSLTCPRNFLFDTKRIIGRHFDDIYVQQFVEQRKCKNFPLDVIRSAQEEPVIKLETTNKNLNVTKSPEEASADLLKYIRQSVTEYVGSNVRDAVISVPAYFSYAQRAATKRAAERAGFNVLKLITEPVAAAIEYTYRNECKSGNLLMFDLGGGTLDLSILKVEKGTFIVKAIEGDIFLGGRDFDDQILNYLRFEIEKRYGNRYIDKETKKGQRFLYRLRKHATRFKEMLSTIDEYTIVLDMDNDSECLITFSRAIFNTLCENLFQRIEDKVQQCLKSAKMNAVDIDNVVLVGGSSKIPKVVEILSGIFGSNKLSNNINKDEAVARGASIHAALLTNEIDKSQKHLITEVAPFSVGILTKYNLMIDIIKKGTPLPISENATVHTASNNQTIVKFEIYEGERKNCIKNNYLGSFVMNNIPLGRAGEVDFKVTFRLDENGVLLVEGKEISTGAQNHLQIEMHNLTLCCRTPFVSLAEEQRLVKDDFLYDKFYRLKLRAETFCYQILYDIDQHNLEAGLMIKLYCEKFLTAIKDMSYQEHDALEKEFATLMENIRDYIHNCDKDLGIEKLQLRGVETLIRRN
ncbi:uncharacterized protein [Euwallacea similis]|uniref:uncharacterized protein n=1 Tax=Euwallacea similis TaxID=1736056 RepID=UPI00344B0A50